MTRTTPARPLDITAHFPELAPLARTAVRLHPRAGAPAVTDSSLGGPLLWPAGEPWPTCPEHAGPWHRGTAPEDVRLGRRVLRAAWARHREGDAELLTEEERAVVDRGRARVRISVDGPLPLIPALQLRAADVPELPRPAGTDLLQVLWCPFAHDPDHLPRVELRWRDSAGIGTPLAAPPRPAVIGDDGYLPEPCVLHPETVTEYPAPHELPEELADRIEAWEEEREEEEGEEGVDGVDGVEVCYQFDLAVAPGSKLGGHAPWSFSDPFPMACAECGAGVRPLLTFDGAEWDGGSGSWRPLQDAAYTGLHFLGPALESALNFGRGYAMQLYACEDSCDHPFVQNMQ
ncbi:hypothetical protein ACF073_03605 [Streptomyces sp. NPDC015171]|uniref:hypothetical protein n=1 Tax=Streptomyces sp. NPDC015171 TaxID=3364945 RepID=UPI0036FBF32A